MKNNIKKMIVMGAVLFLAGMVMIMPSAETKAAGIDGSVEDNITLARVVVPEGEVFATAARVSANGFVDGLGVRLRRKPSTSATIIGLMNLGEYVDIDYSESTTNWYYLERIKNGTFGYANKKYICPI